MSVEFEKMMRASITAQISEIQKTWNIDPLVIKSIDGRLRHVVKITLGISCLGACWAGKNPRDEFLCQISENLWFAIILSLRGHLNAANVLVRQTIELFLKHIYFFSHPIEYQWIQNEDGIKEFGFQMLNEYVLKLYDFDGFEERANCFQALAASFSEASRYVHVHSARFLGRATLGKSRTECIDAFKSTANLIEKVTPSMAALLAVYQYDDFLALNSNEQRLVVLGWPTVLRSSFITWKRKRDLSSP